MPYTHIPNHNKQVRPSAALASLCALRPAYGRPQHVQCFKMSVTMDILWYKYVNACNHYALIYVNNYTGRGLWYFSKRLILKVLNKGDRDVLGVEFTTVR